MRQTSQAATEQQGLRDVERWKDKIEIRLDNRQVAFLFFGSALIACLLFILGVIVGKRLESRGHALAPEIEDPLALLDRVASSVPTAVAGRASDVAVSRAQTAAVTAPAARRLGQAAEEVAAPVPTRALAKVDETGANATAALIAAAKPGKAEKVEKADKVEPPPLAQPPAAMALAMAVAKPKVVLPAKPTAVPPAATAEPARGSNPELLPPSGLTATAPAPAPASRAVAGLAGSSLTPAAASAAAGVAPGRGRFVLQVGSFLERAEAEAFASSFASERPVVIMSEIPGKGTWYRVRVGEFRAFKEAVDAKLSFERRFSKIALVVGPL